MKFDKKVAIVTDAGTGIGAATVRRLHEKVRPSFCVAAAKPS
jgi:NAD(P)-dependent dehydrogenase (short-subunit alcohol dehydrogenase family)